MPEILISGMCMPKGDEVLRLEIYPDGQVQKILGCHGILGWLISEKKDAKAVELSPHGDLKDADVIGKMKYGKIYTYKDTEKAKELIGKKVLASDLLCEIENPRWYAPYELIRVTEGKPYPFTADSCNVFERFDFQFIREIIEAK